MLCREILLHADGSDDTLFSVDGLLELVNHVRRIDQGISEHIVTSGESAMSALHPLIRQQVRRQHVNHGAAIFRAYHVYGAPENI